MIELRKKGINGFILLQLSSLILTTSMLLVDEFLGVWEICLMIVISWMALIECATYFVPVARDKWHSDSTKLFGKGNTYLLSTIFISPIIIVTSYATSYHQLSIWQPSSFNEPLSIIDSIYFSLVTLTTVGYGDVVARSQLARGLVITQLIETIIFGILVIGAFVNIITKSTKNPY